MKLQFATANRLQLAAGQTQTWEQLLRLGSFTDPRYGRFEITPELFDALIKNFQTGVYGQQILVNVAHDDSRGAAGVITALRRQGDWLMAQIDWTPLGIEAVRERGFIYLSAEYADNWQDNEQGDYHGPVLLGCGLTIRPVIKRQKGIKLSEPLLLDSSLVEEITMTLEQFKNALKADLQAYALSDAVIQQLVTAFEVAAGATDDSQYEALKTQFAATGKTLAEAKPEPKIELSVQTGAGLSRDEVLKLLAEQEAARAANAKQLAEHTAALRRQLTDAVNAEKGLPEDLRKLLTEETVKVIDGNMTEAQVKLLAATTITLGQQMAVTRQLSGLGFAKPVGDVHITVDDSNNIKALQEVVDRRLGLLDIPESRRFAATRGALQPENKAFCDKVLARFDHERGARLFAEYKALAGGSVADVSVPTIWERTVIRESLYALIGLQFVNADVLPFATAYAIPYSYRNPSAAGPGDTPIYQGTAIPYAGVIQTTDPAYPIPQKLAFKVPDELRYLAAANQLGNWEVISENTQNASRIIAENTDACIINTIVQDCDAFGAVAVSNEALTSSVNGTNKIFPLANFPVCRPRQLKDLNGTNIGTASWPITVTYNSVARTEWSAGVGSGTYWRMDYNLGELQIVDQTGAAITPANATPLVVSYSYATNVYKFSTDMGQAAAKDFWDTFLIQYSLRKNLLENIRYQMPNFGLMSGTVMSLIAQASTFSNLNSRVGTDLQQNGNLGRINDVPNYNALGPNLWIGDQRIIIGERGVSRFRVVKPWVMSELENVTNSSGSFLGEKQSYGDQFIVMMTPTPLRKAYTSIVLYSQTGRVARAS